MNHNNERAFLSQYNPNFKQSQFMKACGFEEVK